MEKAYWNERWSSNKIGFHRAQVNDLLVKYWPQLNLPKDSHVLVPLCGKAVDMQWLAEQGHQVTGVELSADACRAFFEESGLAFSYCQEGVFEVFQSENIVLYAGDFFQFEQSLFGEFDAIYDRAALVALPSENNESGMREQYLQAINRLANSSTKMLLLTWAYDQSKMPGPPFSIDLDKVRDYYAADWNIDLVGVQSFDPIPPHLVAKGLEAAEDLVFVLS